MKNKLIALGVLSGMFLASGALAAPEWIGGSTQATASFTVNKFSELKFSSSTANKFDGLIKAGEPLFDLTVNAPQGMQVAIAGVYSGLGSAGTIVNDDGVTSQTEVIGIIKDKSMITLKGIDYVPSGVTTTNANAAVVDGTGADINIPFVAFRDNLSPMPGKYNYTFIAQAFTE
ncbi:hypothetical protein [Cedecea neteri]|uniref:Common pilus major fimbrillin subunit EcpA n=1 Tax=Cedecea neteri TaxID=158822 RepID=A0A291DW25_9ENTR|nr:hypothetical protein [Cedecea neteri]ATF92005.1 hypothetical protein CO704_07810 [Cedecea neteri]